MTYVKIVFLFITTYVYPIKTHVHNTCEDCFLFIITHVYAVKTHVHDVCEDYFLFIITILSICLSHILLLTGRIYNLINVYFCTINVDKNDLFISAYIFLALNVFLNIMSKQNACDICSNLMLLRT